MDCNHHHEIIDILFDNCVECFKRALNTNAETIKQVPLGVLLSQNWFECSCIFIENGAQLGYDFSDQTCNILHIIAERFDGMERADLETLVLEHLKDDVLISLLHAKNASGRSLADISKKMYEKFDNYLYNGFSFIKGA
jgi:hypothetical protein